MKPGLLMLPSAVSNSRVHNILPNKIETDFQFSRASAATRVNHQGLIENVGYFSDELIQNGDFSELGPELVTNGDFATDSDWNLGAGWSINNGKAVAENAGSPTAATIAQSGYSLIIGKTYKVVYTVSDYVKGQVRPQFIGGGTSNLPNVSANGTYTEYFVAVNNSTTFRFRAATTDGGFTGKIDNVSVKQVDPDDDWILKPDWEFTDNGVKTTNATGTYNDSALYQLITLDSSKQYKATIDVSSISGSLQVYTGLFSAGFTVNTTGVKSFILDLTSVGGRVNLLPGNGSNVVVKSFSLVEVIGDKPRLDYDPLNPTCPHLLLEPQSTNLFPFSEDYTKSNWTKSNVTITQNAGISPENINNASKMIVSSNAPFAYIYDSLSGSSSKYSISAFVKADGRNIVWLYINSSSTNGTIYYDLSDGSLQAVAGGSGTPTGTITAFPNDWYKITYTSATAFILNSGSGIGISDAKGSTAATVDGTNGVLIYGLQIEAQSYATSYIPTAGASETRVGETCTKAGNVDTFNSEEGVLYAEIQALADDGTNRRIELTDGTSSNRIGIGLTTVANQIKYFLISGGASQVNLDVTISNTLQYNKIAFKYKANDFELYVNGSSVSTDTSGSVSAANTLNVLDFSSLGSTNVLYGKVKGLATYNRALTDNELYTITSTQYSAYSGMVAALGNYTIPC